MADETYKPCCANCGHTQLKYTRKSDGNQFIVIPFAIPADAPLDNRAIQRYAVEHASHISRELIALREQRGGGKSGGLIVVS